MLGTVVESATTPQDRLSLYVEMLPFVEAKETYQQLDRKQGWRAMHNQSAVESRQPTLRCISDHREGARYVNITHYVGITGVGEDSATLKRKHPRAGFFAYDHPTRFADVKDGTSNTLLFIETMHENGPWAAAGMPTLRWIDPGVKQPMGREGFGIVHSDTRWNWGGIKFSANLALADGSVRRVMNPSSEVLVALATIAGGEELPPDW